MLDPGSAHYRGGGMPHSTVAPRWPAETVPREAQYGHNLTPT